MNAYHAVVCPTCKAGVQELCKITSGERKGWTAPRIHRARIKVWVKAYYATMPPKSTDNVY